MTQQFRTPITKSGTYKYLAINHSTKQYALSPTKHITKSTPTISVTAYRKIIEDCELAEYTKIDRM